MKKSRITFLITLAFLAVLLTACSGAASESWPGVAVDGDTVYLSYATQIYQLNLASGAEQWRFPAEADNKINYYAPVALSDDNQQLLVGSYNHVFYSIPSGGAQASWSFSEAEDRYIAKALVLGDQVFAGSADGNLYAMGLDGSTRWKFTAGHAIWGAPATDGKALYVASMDHHIYALNPQSGELIWPSDDLGGQLVAQPALSPTGILYIGAFGSKTKTDNPERSSKLVAVDSSNGQVLWSKPTNGWVWATPLLNEDVLYFGDTEGYIYGFNAVDGTLLWSRQLDTGANRAIIGAPVPQEIVCTLARGRPLIYCKSSEWRASGRFTGTDWRSNPGGFGGGGGQDPDCAYRPGEHAPHSGQPGWTDAMDFRTAEKVVTFG
jgi:outer membrane protein assembly factor BamB